MPFLLIATWLVKLVRTEVGSTIAPAAPIPGHAIESFRGLSKQYSKAYRNRPDVRFIPVIGAPIRLSATLCGGFCRRNHPIVASTAKPSRRPCTTRRKNDRLLFE